MRQSRTVKIDLKIQSSTDKYVSRHRQSNVRRLLPTPDYYRARSYQIIEHSSETARQWLEPGRSRRTFD